MSDENLEARIAALEQKLAKFEKHTLEVLSNFGASLDTERRIVGTLVEAVTSRRSPGRQKAGLN